MEYTSSLKTKRKTCKETMEKPEIQAFTEIDCRVNKNIALKWNTLLQAFQTKEYQVILQYEPSTEKSKGIYKNISMSGLHWETTRTLVLPYLDVIEWMTWKTDHESGTILKFEEKYVASYQGLVLNQLYHFKEVEVKVTPM